MKIKSFGCSLIYGTDLSDCRTGDSPPSELAWPALIAKKLNLDFRCCAGGGRGNLSLLDRLSRNIHSDPSHFFIIQWTYIDRFDYVDHDGMYNANTTGNDFLTVLPSAKDSISSFYYKNLHSEFQDKLTNLVYIKTALDLLLKNNCKFIMTALDDLLWCDRYHITQPMKEWQEYIKPYMTFFEGKNFLDWSREKGYPVSDTLHPLEQAHSAAADYMMPAIESILRKA